MAGERPVEQGNCHRAGHQSSHGAETSPAYLSASRGSDEGGSNREDATRGVGVVWAGSVVHSTPSGA